MELAHKYIYVVFKIRIWNRNTLREKKKGKEGVGSVLRRLGVEKTDAAGMPRHLPISYVLVGRYILLLNRPSPLVVTAARRGCEVLIFLPTSLFRSFLGWVEDWLDYRIR